MKNSARYKKEVLQGFKTAGTLLLGFFTLLCLLGGIAGLSGNEKSTFGIFGDCVAVLIALTILFATARRWGRWIGGFFGIHGAINGLLVISSGHALHWPYKPIAAIEAVSVLAFSVLLLILTYPLAVSHRVIQVKDRLCLLGATIAFCFSILGQQRFYIWTWMTVCLSFLIILRLRYRVKHHRHCSDGLDNPLVSNRRV